MLVICLTGCRKDPPFQPVTPPPAAPSALAPGGGLAEQLSNEAHARPADTTTVEQVIERLKTAGAAVGEPQQSIARTHGAAYCANIRSPDVYVLVCEYANAEQLAAGRPLTENIFKSFPDHMLATSKHTSVMLQWLTPMGKTQIDAVVKALAVP
jgi:hypothetical protein